MSDFRRASEFSKDELGRMEDVTYHALIHLRTGDVDVRGYIKRDDVYTLCVKETKEDEADLIGSEFPLNMVSIGPPIFGIAPLGYVEAQG
jgi:hypothetical protein